MKKLSAILAFAFKCVLFGAMVTLFGYNIVLMWNSDNVFKVELIVLLGLLVLMCVGAIYVSYKELAEEGL